MGYKIVFLDEYTMDGADLDPVRQLGDYTGYEDTPHDRIVENASGADIVITNKTPLKADTLAQLPGLKLICIAATGMNNVDLDAAAKAGIAVKNAVDYSSHSVAEHTLMGALALYKQTAYMDDYVKSGGYASSGKLFNYERPTYELFGKEWGIIGLGHIGSRVAQLASAFGCNVSYYSTSGKNDNKDYTRKSLEELLSASDVVSVHAPLSRNTYHMLDYHQFSLMKKTAVVINVARGSLINEEGLTRALNDGLIAGAALDVYSREPVETENPINRVVDKYKLVLTPHSAWSTKEALQNLIGKIAGNIMEFLKSDKG